MVLYLHILDSSDAIIKKVCALSPHLLILVVDLYLTVIEEVSHVLLLDLDLFLQGHLPPRLRIPNRTIALSIEIRLSCLEGLEPVARPRLDVLI